MLRREVEVKESKLSSSMNSIKTFWSPELKKERALRKDEVSKITVWKEQYRVIQDEAQVRIPLHHLERMLLRQNLWFVISDSILNCHQIAKHHVLSCKCISPCVSAFLRVSYFSLIAWRRSGC